MANDDGDVSRFRGVNQESKALWAAMDLLEARIDRKIETLSKDIRRDVYRQQRAPETRTTHFGNNEETPIRTPRPPPPPPDFSNSDGEETPWDATHPHWETNQRHHRGNQSRSFKFKLEMASFDGYMHIEDFLDWLDNVEDYFECMGVDEAQKVRFVAYKLKGGARAWWKQIQNGRTLEGKQPISSWSRMNQMLRTRFLPTNFSQTLYLQCLGCKQGTRSIKEYTEEFYPLGARASLVEDESQQVARFIGGLREEIQEKLEMSSVWSLNEAVNLAFKGEKQVLRSTSRSAPTKKTIVPEFARSGLSPGKAPFEIVYTKVPNQTVDLLALPQFRSKPAATLAEHIQQLHQEVHTRLDESNSRYKAAADSHRRFKDFQEGDLVMVFLRRDRFPEGTYNKLRARKVGPCRILRKISDNAYTVELPVDLTISNTFDVADLFPYHLPDAAPEAIV
ncbi:hypothetical protein LWI29_019351 [Acer saccharum]|uniref:Retrotransposon gag domain-containing protein n=1 Tax=Acer saccharum TaxID=4024 RepID=A0AA39RMA8_ACESA|nr:hypothetical protein LWI29_019351 [Acer saccharum]